MRVAKGILSSPRVAGKDKQVATLVRYPIAALSAGGSTFATHCVAWS